MFRYSDNGDYGFRYFADPFPAMPDASKYIEAFNGNVMMVLSDLAFIYYLPFFMDILEKHPDSSDHMDVCNLWYRVQDLSPEIKQKYATLLDEADKILEKMER